MEVAGEVMEMIRGHQVLVVPGGGPFADAVRRAYNDHRLSEEAAHRMAILAMDQYGVFLSDVSGVPTTRDPLETGLPAVLLPSGYLEEKDPFEASWEVASDTIAAHVARMRGEEEFLLLKSVGGIGAGGKAVKEISARDLASLETGVVDRALPAYLESYQMNCRVVNGREPERVEAVLRGQPEGVLLRGKG